MKNTLLLIAIFVTISGCSKEIDDPKKPYESAGTLLIFTDKDTGCEYVTYSNKNLHPRLTASGKQRGCIE